MRAWRVPFVVPVLVLALLLAPVTGGVALADTATARQQATSTEPELSITDLLKDLNQSLKSHNESLETWNAVLQAENEALKQENALLRSQLEAALKRLQELEATASGVTTVEGVAAQQRSRVFRIDVYDFSGRLVSTGRAVAVTVRLMVGRKGPFRQAAAPPGRARAALSSWRVCKDLS